MRRLAAILTASALSLGVLVAAAWATAWFYHHPHAFPEEARFWWGLAGMGLMAVLMIPSMVRYRRSGKLERVTYAAGMAVGYGGLALIIPPVAALMVCGQIVWGMMRAFGFRADARVANATFVSSVLPFLAGLVLTACFDLLMGTRTVPAGWYYVVAYTAYLVLIPALAGLFAWRMWTGAKGTDSAVGLLSAGVCGAAAGLPAFLIDTFVVARSSLIAPWFGLVVAFVVALLAFVAATRLWATPTAAWVDTWSFSGRPFGHLVTPRSEESASG